MAQIDSNLLNSLRIDNTQRDDADGGPPRWLWPSISAVLACLLAGGAAAWYWQTQGQPTQPTPAAANAASSAASGADNNAATAAKGTNTSPNTGTVLQATGYVTARRQATVSTQITGTLTQVLIEAGDRVKAGQVIARLEDSALRATLSAALAHVAVAQAQVVQLQAQLAQAEAEARRQTELAASGMVAKQTAEQARTAVASFSAQLVARQREVEAALAQQKSAQVNFDFSVVRAPFAGVVTEKTAQVGEIVSPLSGGGGFTRTGVGTIVDMDSLEVDVDVGEAFIGQVTPGMTAEAVLDAYANWRIPAHVVAIVPAADRGKATIRVRVALEQKDARIVPNMGARVSFIKR